MTPSDDTDVAVKVTSGQRLRPHGMAIRSCNPAGAAGHPIMDWESGTPARAALTHAPGAPQHRPTGSACYWRRGLAPGGGSIRHARLVIRRDAAASPRQFLPKTAAQAPRRASHS